MVNTRILLATRVLLDAVQSILCEAFKDAKCNATGLEQLQMAHDEQFLMYMYKDAVRTSITATEAELTLDGALEGNAYWIATDKEWRDAFYNEFCEWRQTLRDEKEAQEFVGNFLKTLARSIRG